MNLVSKALILILFSAKLWANDIRVVTEEWPPYNYTVDGKLQGVSTEVVEAVLIKSGLSYDVKVYPWARAYQYAQQNPNVLIYTISRTKEREKLFTWVGPIVPRTISLFKLKTNSLEFSSLDDIEKYRVGLIRNEPTHELIKNKGLGNRLEILKSHTQKLKMLLHGRVDLITGNELALAYQLKKLHRSFNDLENVHLLDDKGGYYMGLSKNSTVQVYDKIQAALNVLKNSGEIDRIIDSYTK